jgi:hypothetical protein
VDKETKAMQAKFQKEMKTQINLVASKLQNDKDGLKKLPKQVGVNCNCFW